MKPIFKNKYAQAALFILIGLLLGRLFFHHEEVPKQTAAKVEKKKTVWTCSMHPQIRRDKPGKCPICEMDLIPLAESGSTVNPEAIQLDSATLQLANVETVVISRQKPVKEIRLYGKVQPDERLVQTLPAHFPGRIEQLFVNYTGEPVGKGQVVASIYSPELVTAQQELLEALKYGDSNPALVDAAIQKLRQWKLSESQIADIQRSRRVKERFSITSSVSGTVINRRVNVGDYVGQGQSLFEVVNLSHVWVLFDAYESDLPWIEKGATVSFTVQSLPGKVFTGKISFIDPVINPVSRVARLRIEINNSGGLLKPEMFANAVIRSVLNAGEVLMVPKSAVLWTGKRSVVYVKDTQSASPAFVRHEILLGPETGNSYVVEDGLDEGDEVVAQGSYAVDAAAQLDGKPSMMSEK